MGLYSSETPPPISRNLTSLFLKYRHDRRGTSRSTGGLLASPDYLGHQQEQRPLRGDVEMSCLRVDAHTTSLPPQWMDSAQEARDDIKAIRSHLKDLAKAQNKRLLKVFDDSSSPDKEVEHISGQVSTLVRRCEQTIHAVKTRGGTGTSQADRDFRVNVQRGLATKLQECSSDFRGAQKEYLNKVKERQRGSSLWDEGAVTSGKSVDLGFNDGQLLDLEEMETTATTRSAEICQIASSITELHTVFKELAVLVIDQGSILDRIDYNIEGVVEMSREANVQLQKAEKSSKSNRAMKCLMGLLFFNVLLIAILIVKSRH